MLWFLRGKLVCIRAEVAHFLMCLFYGYSYRKITDTDDWKMLNTNDSSDIRARAIIIMPITDPRLTINIILGHNKLLGTAFFGERTV